MSPGRFTPSVKRGRCAAAIVALTGLLGATGSALAASSSSPASHGAAPKAQDPSAPRPPVSSDTTGDVDVSSRNVVARARMLECGHQWSNMKRAGTATGTWKDFSRGCLAQR